MRRDWSAVFARVEREDAARRARAASDLRVPRRADLWLEAHSAFARGCAILDRVFELISRFDVPPKVRYSVQIRMHHALVSTICGRVFGEAVDGNEREQIMERYRFDSIDHAFFSVMPRRFGKSEAYSIYLAAVLLSVPRLRVIVVAHKRSAADKTSGLLGLVEDKLRFLAGNTLNLSTDREAAVGVKVSKDDVRSVLALTDTDVSHRIVTRARPPHLSRRAGFTVRGRSSGRSAPPAGSP